MKICIAGKNNIAVEILLYLLNMGVDKKEILIISNKTDNGEDSWQRSLRKLASIYHINEVILKDLYHIEELIFLSLEFDRIINPALFKTNRLFNIHFSLLPKYKGMFTSIIPILNNEKYTGVTLHKIDSGIDTGEIIAQSKFEILYNDNSRDIYINYIKYGIELIKKNIKNILKDNFSSNKQNYLESSYFSKQSIDFSKIHIDLNQTAINIHNQVRAFNFREYQVPKIFNTEIISSTILYNRSDLKPGVILFETDIYYCISTIDNNIILYKDKSNELFEACHKGDIDKVIKLIQIPKIINIQNEKGWTPLIVAIYHNNKNIIKILLANGADLSINNFNGTTPMMYAKNAYSTFKDRETIELLKKFNLNLYQNDFYNKNIFDYCIKNNELEVMDIIKEKSK